MNTHYLRLVNKDNPIKEIDRQIRLSQAPFTTEEMYLESTVAEQLDRLVRSCDLEREIVVMDGFRTFEKQQEIWDETLKEKGELFTKKYVAKPGCSEHELGLAVDLGLANLTNDYIRPSFAEGAVVAKFLKEMPRFGFILRYPKGKERVTHISYEPWHFRYVGWPHSDIIMSQGWALEEYISFLEDTRGQLYGG